MITITRKNEKLEQGNYFTEKWGVSGRVCIEEGMSDATMTVEKAGHVVPSIVHTVVAHETGHVDFFEDRLLNEANLTPQSFVEGDIWFIEVDAWIRGIDNHLKVPFTLAKGQLALDALNSYRRGYGVTDEQWLEAKQLIADRCTATKMLMKYEPLEPPPGTPPPAPSITVVGAEWGQEEGNENDKPGQKGEKDIDPITDNEVDLEERDNWLLSEEGMNVLKFGRHDRLEKELALRGFPVKHPLPVVAKVTFANSGGHWPYA